MNRGAVELSALRLTQAEIARACGVSRVAVHHWQKGTTKPDKNVRPILAERWGLVDTWWDEPAAGKAPTAPKGSPAHKAGSGRKVTHAAAEPPTASSPSSPASSKRSSARGTKAGQKHEAAEHRRRPSPTRAKGRRTTPDYVVIEDDFIQDRPARNARPPARSALRAAFDGDELDDEDDVRCKFDEEHLEAFERANTRIEKAAELERICSKLLRDTNEDPKSNPVERANVLKIVGQILAGTGRLTGELESITKILKSNDWKRIEAVIADSLKPYPQAARALARGLRELDNARTEH